MRAGRPRPQRCGIGDTYASSVLALLRRRGCEETAGAGWVAYADSRCFPTGDELVREYLEPLAAMPEFAGVIQTGARVSAISRSAIDKVVSRDRETRPFVLGVETARWSTP